MPLPVTLFTQLDGFWHVTNLILVQAAVLCTHSNLGIAESTILGLLREYQVFQISWQIRADAHNAWCGTAHLIFIV